jgi:hypothetical protein
MIGAKPLCCCTNTHDCIGRSIKIPPVTHHYDLNKPSTMFQLLITYYCLAAPRTEAGEIEIVYSVERKKFDEMFSQHDVRRSTNFALLDA